MADDTGQQPAHYYVYASRQSERMRCWDRMPLFTCSSHKHMTDVRRP